MKSVLELKIGKQIETSPKISYLQDFAIATYRTASNTDADYELAGVNKEPNVGWTSYSGGLNGSTQPFKALQPYKVLIYIRSKKGV